MSGITVDNDKVLEMSQNFSAVNNSNIVDKWDIKSVSPHSLFSLIPDVDNSELVLKEKYGVGGSMPKMIADTKEIFPEEENLRAVAFVMPAENGNGEYIAVVHSMQHPLEIKDLFTIDSVSKSLELAGNIYDVLDRVKDFSQGEYPDNTRSIEDFLSFIRSGYPGKKIVHTGDGYAASIANIMGVQDFYMKEYTVVLNPIGTKNILNAFEAAFHRANIGSELNFGDTIFIFNTGHSIYNIGDEHSQVNLWQVKLHLPIPGLTTLDAIKWNDMQGDPRNMLEFIKHQEIGTVADLIAKGTPENPATKKQALLDMYNYLEHKEEHDKFAEIECNNHQNKELCKREYIEHLYKIYNSDSTFTLSTEVVKDSAIEFGIDYVLQKTGALIEHLGIFPKELKPILGNVEEWIASRAEEFFDHSIEFVTERVEDTFKDNKFIVGALGKLEDIKDKTEEIFGEEYLSNLRNFLIEEGVEFVQQHVDIDG